MTTDRNHRRAVAAFAAAFASLSALAASAATVGWDFPRNGNCHEGMAFADGTTGALVWGGGDTVKITFGRADLWDDRGGYSWTPEQSYTNIVAAIEAKDADKLKAMFSKVTPPGEPRNPTMVPVGRVDIKIPGAELKHGELDPFTGTAYIDFATAGGTRRIEFAMAKTSGGLFAAKLPAGVAFEAKAVPASANAKVRKSLASLSYKEPVARPDGFSQALPKNEAVSLAFRAKDGEVVVATGRGENGATEKLAKAKSARYADVKAGAVAHWTAFWNEGAKISVPDPVVQRVFDYGMYRYGAMTDPDGVPAGLQGPWIEDHRLPPWSGDYHFNINVQECYSPGYRGGHFANFLPLFRMVLSWRDTLRRNARLFVGIEDGYSLPHSVSAKGVNIGGFWTGTIDHGSTAWVADMMWRYVKYSGDVAFLKDGGYDFMKGAMNVYLAMAEERDGKYSFPTGPSPEFGGANMAIAVGRDPSFQLAAAHRLVRDLAAAAKLLGEKPDPRWADFDAKLPPYTADKTGINLFVGRPFNSCHRHHSHMAGLYPFDTIDAEGSAKDVVAATYATWDRLGTKAWTGWCVPWAAILDVHFGRADRAAERIKAWDYYYCDEGHGSHHNSVRDGFTNCRGGRSVMQMDAQCAAATAAMELMVHEVNGVPKFFRGCPAAWKEVSFENIALSDGRRVSGVRKDGKVSLKYSR